MREQEQARLRLEHERKPVAEREAQEILRQRTATKIPATVVRVRCAAITAQSDTGNIEQL